MKRFSFQLCNEGGEKKDDEFQCSKNEMCCASFSFSASAFMFNRSKALLRLSSLLDCPSRPDRQRDTQCTIELRSETGLLSSPRQIPLALSSIFAPIDRQEPLMNWMTTTVVGKNISNRNMMSLETFCAHCGTPQFLRRGICFLCALM